ncbi:uncharacterized protein LOC131953448 [Physella acuta]|uniref:uncharacterized protein LOC131953448 n=1 Tax=Physella acuta TaxID=109671 RepID=UPI0027DDA70C|nr:uncharacterized protein LOC131953448 [Physella acuta]
MESNTNVANNAPTTDVIRAKQNVVFAVLTLLLNTAVIVSIATSSFLRQKSKYRTIISISIGNIIACFAYFPLDTAKSLGFQGVQELNLTLKAFINGVHTFCVPAVIGFSLMFIGLEYCITRKYGIIAHKRVSRTQISLWIPWTFGCVALLLLVLTPCPQVLTDYVNTQQIQAVTSPFNKKNVVVASPCQYIISLASILSLTIGWGFIPLLLAFLVVLYAIQLNVRYRLSRDYRQVVSSLTDSVTSDREVTWSQKLLDTAVATFLLLGVHVLYLTQRLSEVTCLPESYCVMALSANRSVELARWAMAFILPAVWLLDEDFRTVCAFICGRLCLGLSASG